MKVLRTILIILIVLFVLFCIAMAFLPSNFDISRSTVVKTTPSHAYSYVSDYKNWPEWIAWYEDDSTMTFDFGETTRGVGGSYSWVSESQGSGGMEFIEAEPGKSLKSKINFTAPYESESTGYWKFKEIENGKTSITWGFMGKFSFFMRWMPLFMEKQVGSSFDRGLANIKRIVEKNAPKYGQVMVKEVEGIPYFGIIEEMKISEMDSAGFGRNFGKIAKYLEQDMQNVMGAPMAIYHKWDEEADSTKIEFAIPVQSEKGGNDEIMIGTTYSGKVVMLSFKGPYSQTGEMHGKIAEYITSNSMTIIGSPYEVYVTDPSVVEDPKDYITEIYYPVAEM